MNSASSADFDRKKEFNIPALFAQMKSRRIVTPTEISLRELAMNSRQIKEIHQQYLMRALQGETSETLASWLAAEITKCSTIKK